MTAGKTARRLFMKSKFLIVCLIALIMAGGIFIACDLNSLLGLECSKDGACDFDEDIICEAECVSIEGEMCYCLPF
jgi:hypothetical protein